MSELHIDTAVCRNYAQKIEQVMSIYQYVSDGANSISVDAAMVVAENGDDVESLGESGVALLRQLYVNRILHHMGTKRLGRLKTHFTDVADRMERAEGKLMSRGERLYDL